MSFYTIVVIIAIIILIIALTTVGLLLGRLNTSKKTFPPSASDCPDYWVNSNGSCAVPNASGINRPTDGYNNTGETPGWDSGSINFTNVGWKNQGISELCAKKKWANKYNVLWSGVSNYNSCDA
jgi:hypothetical protein